MTAKQLFDDQLSVSVEICILSVASPKFVVSKLKRSSLLNVALTLILIAPGSRDALTLVQMTFVLKETRLT